MTPSPPWKVQCEVVRDWHAEAASANSPKRSQASLQLAICYHIGYGVRPNPDLMLRYFTTSLDGNDTTMMLYHRLVTAMNVDVDQPSVDMIYMTDLDRRLRHHELRETYFAARVRQHQQLRLIKKRGARGTADCQHQRTMNLVELVIGQELSLLRNLLSSNKYDNIEISCALLEASRCGDASMVQLICAHCDKLVYDERLITPLHWLIMFEESEVVSVAKALICGASADQAGLCRANINSIPTAEPGTLFIPEHCLELFGTPLHWAVRTRNLKLVEILVELGADINARTEIPELMTTYFHRPQRPSLSPLDIAVAFHLPEIVARLLDLGAKWEGGGRAFNESQPAFLHIGLASVPFSRYIVHGKQCRDALKKTIRVLDERGYNINETDFIGNDPITVALSNCDCEPYIIEELILAGAIPSHVGQRNSQYSHYMESAIEMVISNASLRRYSVGNLRLLLPYVRNINDCNLFGFNATHSAAVGGSEAMVEVLSSVEGFDIDAPMSTSTDARRRAMSALHLAAIFGHPEVINLLVRKGANMEILDELLYTPLLSATLLRKIKAVDALIELGANVFIKSPQVRGTVLHEATAGWSSGYSMVKHLLTKHSRLQEDSIINAIDYVGRTALHKAAYFGDYEAVEILLEKGADRTLMDASRGSMPGRTPLECAEHELWRHSKGGWDLDLKRITTGGSQAMKSHDANLHEIVSMLKDYGLD